MSQESILFKTISQKWFCTTYLRLVNEYYKIYRCRIMTMWNITQDKRSALNTWPMKQSSRIKANKKKIAFSRGSYERDKDARCAVAKSVILQAMQNQIEKSLTKGTSWKFWRQIEVTTQFCEKKAYLKLDNQNLLLIKNEDFLNQAVDSM